MFSRIRTFPFWFELCLHLMNFHHFPPFWHRVRNVSKCDKLVTITLFGIYLVNKTINMMNRNEYALELWILQNWCLRIDFTRQKWNEMYECIPSACESVYREIFVPHRETVRLSSKPWDLRGLLLDGGRGVQCSDKFMHGIVLSWKFCTKV